MAQTCTVFGWFFKLWFPISNPPDLKKNLVNWIPVSRAAEAKVITLSALSSVCFDL